MLELTDGGNFRTVIGLACSAEDMMKAGGMLSWVGDQAGSGEMDLDTSLIIYR